MAILPASHLCLGDRSAIEKEPVLPDIQFHIHQCTNRVRPQQKENIIIFPHFAEFGSELVESIYCLPAALNSRYQGKYSIVLTWFGRLYLYRHLVDEVWEIKEEFQFLREYCRAFHHDSRNLKRAEKAASQFGTLFDINEYGVFAAYPKLERCANDQCNGPIDIHESNYQHCSTCNGFYPPPGFYHDLNRAKQFARWPAPPSRKKYQSIVKYLRPNAVGVVARARKCYGRNLRPEFYEKLIVLLESMGYQPIWFGEKATTLPCPFDRIPDFRSAPEANDLEATLALISYMKFTVQFWTASTRLAGLAGVPYLIFESPDQIWGQGQEGYRLSLCTRGPRKLVLAHYRTVYEDNQAGLSLVQQAIKEMEQQNFNDIVGLVENPEIVYDLREKNPGKLI